jgi:adenine-specific DNA-methyltransferase
VDKEKEYVGIALDRLQKLLRGELKYRPLGTQKFVPTGREKVSQIPAEWLSK